MSVRSSPSPLPKWAGLSSTRSPSTTRRPATPRAASADQLGVGMSAILLPQLAGGAGQHRVEQPQVVLVGQLGAEVGGLAPDPRRPPGVQLVPDFGAIDHPLPHP